MKKRNVILQASLAAALTAMTATAFAGTTSLSATAVTYATEQFAGTGAVSNFYSPTMTVAAGQSLAASSVVTVGIALTNGLWGAVPGVTSPGSSSAITATLSSTSSTLLIPITIGPNTPVALGSTLASVSGVITAGTLASSGATISATATIYSGTITSANLATATILDSASPTATIATSSPGFTLSAAANTSTSKIDLTATTPSVAFTNVTASATETGSTTTFKLGRLTIKTNGKQLWDNSAAMTTASVPAISATIAAPAGFFAALGTTGLITLKDASATNGGSATPNACTGGTSATSVVQTLASAASQTGIVVTGSAVTAESVGRPYDVCMTVPGTSIALVTGTPTIAATLGSATTSPSWASSLAATNLQALTTNGQSYDVRNYVPAAATGYTTYVRVINTGSLDAVVSVALVDDTTGTAGTSGALGTVKAGAATNFTPTQIEAVTGAIAATARPRLRITAPTSGMNVQTFLVQPNGTVSDMTGAQ